MTSSPSFLTQETSAAEPTLPDWVSRAFMPGGVLAQALDPFYPRAGQTEMAIAVASAIAAGQPLVVEAGTGVGKTYAYLVPLLLGGKKALISTATKTLQDQLFQRDLPRLAQALGVPLRMALLKGRSSYLCHYRLERVQTGFDVDSKLSRSLAQVVRWAKVSKSGDLAELPGWSEQSALTPQITSTRENCLGSECPSFRQCHVQQARREAMLADVVVINHHLFFADLAVRESGVAELLPSVEVAVFDEAHQLNETGLQFLGQQLSGSQLIEFARDFQVAAQQHARGAADWQTLAVTLERAARALGVIFAHANTQSSTRLAWEQQAPQGLNDTEWQALLQQIADSCEQCYTAMEAVAEAAPELRKISERAQALTQQAQRFALAPGVDRIRWVELGGTVRLVESSLDVGATLGQQVAQARQAGRAWIFTSATLGEDDSLAWFTQPCGLSEVATLRVSSPFAYEQQSWVYVPNDLPDPKDEQHSTQVAALAARAAQVLGGRTMVLTTSLRALRHIGSALRARLTDTPGTAPNLEVLVQGEASKRELMERFQQSGSGGRVLVASASFWQGVDIPGAALQLLIIDKLPFPVPSDPVVEARVRRLRGQNRNPFQDYFLAEAAVVLKQGAGRLIRRESDQGVLVVCDKRLGQASYGRRLLAALPPMQKLGDEAAFLAVLRQLALASL